ncbi:MAG: cytochrome C oxidase subunit IV family protein [Bacteroidales bacterium]|nr:cytochrome C oxidase subunit IV family protein [Bacteroidales bacterium]
MSDTTHHIVPYRTYALILLLLLVLTGISVAVTQIELTRWATIVALLIASTKSAIVLAIFMHLKFEQRVYKVMVIFVVLVVTAVIVLTFFDYGFR